MFFCSMVHSPSQFSAYEMYEQAECDENNKYSYTPNYGKVLFQPGPLTVIL